MARTPRISVIRAINRHSAEWHIISTSAAMGFCFGTFAAVSDSRGGSSGPVNCVSLRINVIDATRHKAAVTTPMVKIWVLGFGTFSHTRNKSTERPAAAAPMFMKRYQRLKPALRDLRVVNLAVAD